MKTLILLLFATAALSSCTTKKLPAGYANSEQRSVLEYILEKYKVPMKVGTYRFEDGTTVMISKEK